MQNCSPSWYTLRVISINLGSFHLMILLAILGLKKLDLSSGKSLQELVKPLLKEEQSLTRTNLQYLLQKLPENSIIHTQISLRFLDPTNDKNDYDDAIVAAISFHPSDFELSRLTRIDYFRGLLQLYRNSYVSGRSTIEKKSC